MKKLLTAVALSIALPAVAHAQAAPAPEKQGCCEKMKAEGKECCCCEDMDHKGNAKHGDKKGDDTAHHKH